MAKITFENKVKLNDNTSIPAINKVRDVDMNEIKSVVNENDNDFRNSLPVVLYTNPTGTNGNITLSDNSNNYSYLEVYAFESVTNANLYTKYDVSSEKNLNLNSANVTENGTLMRFISTDYSIANNTITPISANSGIVHIFGRNINAQQQENAVLITKVVGYK